jgi:hypothetical protein
MKKLVTFIGSLEAFWQFHYQKKWSKYKWGAKAAKMTAERHITTLILTPGAYAAAILLSIYYLLYHHYLIPSSLGVFIFIAIEYIFYFLFLEADVKKVKAKLIEDEFFSIESNYVNWRKKSRLVIFSLFFAPIGIGTIVLLLNYFCF